MLRPVVHMLLHVAAPGVIARIAFAERWKRAWGIMILTMAVDLDHLMADPVFDPNRCSIGFHPLHTLPAVLAYLILACFPRTRVAGVGLLIHMALDGLDCLWMRWL